MGLKKLIEELDEKSRKQIGYAVVGAAITVMFALGTVTGKIISDRPVKFETGIDNSVNLSIGGAAAGSAGQGSSSSAGSSTGQTSQGSDTNTGADANTGTDTNTNTNTDTGTGEKSTKEIIDIFNESANRVKTEAVKVTKNFEDRTHLEELLILPKALEGMAKDLMAEAFKDDTEPIVYATKEEIVANYQVPGQTWVSQLTEAEVMEATIKDNGTEYEIYMKLHPTQNPEPGNGVAKAFDTITTAEVRERAPSILKEFTTEYFDCVINCKIDKATGRMTWANYDSPLVLKLKVEFFGTLDAQVGMRFAKDYTIEY